jgi:uncharacterized protein
MYNKISFLQNFGLSTVLFYQRNLSRFTGRCRYSPSCSGYMFKSIERFGFFKGVYLGAVRLVDCSRKQTRGYYPVPKSFQLQPSNKGINNQGFGRISLAKQSLDSQNFSSFILPKADTECCGELECCSDCCCSDCCF